MNLKSGAETINHCSTFLSVSLRWLGLLGEWVRLWRIGPLVVLLALSGILPLQAAIAMGAEVAEHALSLGTDDDNVR